MQRVSELMTRDVRSVSPQENLQRAAQMMGELDVGALPVCDGGRLVGMVTDRDITLRSTAVGKSPQEAHVDEVMSTEVRWCFEDQPVDEVMIQMADSRIRRVPVVSHDEAHRLVGIIALGDLATRTQESGQKDDMEQVVEMVSAPTRPTGQGTGGASAMASGAGSEGGDLNELEAAQADTGGTPKQAGAGSAGDAGQVSLADGTGAHGNANMQDDSAGKAPGTLTPAEGAQATGAGGSAAGASLADGTGTGTGQEPGTSPATAAPDDATENMRSGPT